MEYRRVERHCPESADGDARRDPSTRRGVVSSLNITTLGEALDGALTGSLMAASEEWPDGGWVYPLKPARWTLV
jgi:hypothetical protein